jgi:PAS domain S-box-containing protein
MTDHRTDIDAGPDSLHLQELSRRVAALPADIRELFKEILEASSSRDQERAHVLDQIWSLIKILEQERQLQQMIMDNTAIHLAFLDPEFNYVRVNSAYARGTGHTVAELVGRNHFELFPHSKNRAIFEKVRDTGESREFWAMPVDFPEQPGRGTTFWDWAIVPVKDEQEEVQGLIISSAEVTERVQLRREREQLQKELGLYAERLEEMVAQRTSALQASEARFRTVFEASVLGIALLDREGRLLASNPALQTMLGYSRKEMDGRTVSEFSHPDDAQVDKDLMEEVVSGRRGHFQIQKRYVRKDGQVLWIELTASSVRRSPEDEPEMVVALVADITEKRRTQEALLRAERVMIAGRLGASLAHEINNPLQSVIGCLGLAEEILQDGAEVRRYLEIATEQLERAAGIVSQLRDLSREAEAKKREPTDLNALVEKSLLLTRKRCQNQGVEVTWSPAADMAPVPLVPDRMQQVFLNLVLNAVDAMPEGGRLFVSTTPTEQPEGVYVRFVDTGVGIEADRLSQLFEPFHSTRPEGLGLGLYISKGIVEEHGGHIEVESLDGEGTTFAIWLPR